MTATTTIPVLADLTAVRLAITCEVWPTFPGDRHNPPDPADIHIAIARARQTLRDYFRPLRDVLTDDRADLIDDDADDVVRSEHDAEVLAVEGSAHLTLTPDEWLAASHGWLLDLDWTGDGRTDNPSEIPALPDRIVPTLGILDADGITPAVAIEGTDHGWGYGGYEPTVVASFYVALALTDKAAP